MTKFHGDGSSAGTDWAQGSSGGSNGGSNGGRGVLGQLQYSAYCEASYGDVWEHYAWHKPLPWWFPLDFGKVNSSYAWDHEEHVKVRLLATHSTKGHALQHMYHVQLAGSAAVRCIGLSVLLPPNRTCR